MRVLSDWKKKIYIYKYIDDITRWRKDRNVISEWQEKYLTSEILATNELRSA